MGAIFGTLAVAMALVLIALVVTGIVAYHRGYLTFPTIVHTYTALILAVCIVLALAGGALLIKSIASSVIARDFSYQSADFPQVIPQGKIEPLEPTAAERARTQAGDDLTAGITLLIIGIGLGVAHAFGNAVAARRDPIYGAVVERGFAVILLAVGTVTGLASSAILLNDLLRRYVVTTAAAAPYNQPRPGGALGFALLFVPLWIYFARRVWRTLEKSDAIAAPGSARAEPGTSGQS